MRTFKIILFVFIAFMSSKCAISNPECLDVAMPDSLGLKITKSGAIVPDLILSETKLSYFKHNEKRYVPDFTSDNIITELKNKGYISSRAIGFISANDNIKVYYLEYSNGWETDTLYVDYLPKTRATHCQIVLLPIKVNGVYATVYRGDHYFLYEVNKP